MLILRRRTSRRASLLILEIKKKAFLVGQEASLLVLQPKKEDFLEGQFA